MARHTYLCPLRWADMDLLGHVNNVVYVDYLQEARVDMLRLHAPLSGGEELAEGVVVVRHEVDYLAPLTFRAEPVAIDTWVSEVRAASFTLTYEIYDEVPGGERLVYLRARSVLAPYVFASESPRRLTAEERRVLDSLRDEGPALMTRPRRIGRIEGPARGVYPCQVRFSDVDVYRHVNNVKYFEYIQEARIQLLTPAFAGRGDWAVPMVVGALDVDYAVPILLRLEPYPISSWVTRVGNSSFEVTSEISDGERTLARARAAMVCFDPEAGRALPMPDWFRDYLGAPVEGISPRR